MIRCVPRRDGVQHCRVGQKRLVPVSDTFGKIERLAGLSVQPNVDCTLERRRGRTQIHHDVENGPRQDLDDLHFGKWRRLKVKPPQRTSRWISREVDLRQLGIEALCEKILTHPGGRKTAATVSVV